MGEMQSVATFMIGFCGAVFVAVLFAAGFACGWKLCRIWERHKRPELKRPQEAELRQMTEQQQAFQQLQNYSAERAYGLVEEYR